MASKGGNNIQVAVRVRPFSEREKKRKANLIVSMQGNNTVLANPHDLKSNPKTFTFDHSYWSHKGYKVRDDGYFAPDKDSYIDQVKVFNDLGKGLLSNAWKGFNCSIFAYGQTGSGKSYSIMGNASNQGLVPRTCEELFAEIDRKKSSKGPKVNYAVKFSMIEIYNEHVRDLLSKDKQPKGGHQVRMKPDQSFYVEGLLEVPVGSFRDIRVRMSEGEKRRTIASTKMNETSSRAHTLVAISFVQNDLSSKKSTVASINLVDLAGSERQSQAGTTGDRLEEAKNINKSLMTLGSVIEALVKIAKGGQQSTHVRYRDSVLTMLLKNALGGNSKTAMIAAISPDAENYEQTLSTLRYADRAKSIKNNAKVNTTETDKMIKKLIAEKEKLLRDLQNAKNNKQMGYSEEDIAKIKAEQEKEIIEYKEQMDDIEKAWEKRLEDARKEMEEVAKMKKQQEEAEKKKPHFSNLNEDPALSNKLVFVINQGKLIVGNGKDDSKPDITLNGPRISKNHATVTLSKSGEVALEPTQGCLVLHNGQELKEKKQLKHQDRVQFGSNNLFVFLHPAEAEALKKKGRKLQDITYDFAQSEIAKHSGLDIAGEDGILQEEVLSVMQMVNNINAMAEDMDKRTEFSVMLVSPEARGLENGRTEVYVRMRDQMNDNLYLFNKNSFLNRQVLMQEQYQLYDDSGSLPDIHKASDPFWEPPETAVIIGVVSVPLAYLSHMMEFVEEDPFAIIDYNAKQAGYLRVDFVPCDARGNEDVDVMVDDENELIGKPIAFKIKVHQAMNLPPRFEKSWCQYKFYNDTEFKRTGGASGLNPKYDHEQLLRFKADEVDHKLIDYLKDKSLAIEVWGQQRDRPSSSYPKASGSRKPRAEDLQQKLDQIAAIVDRMPPSAEVEEIRRILNS